jgi:hypothetical protein
MRTSFKLWLTGLGAALVLASPLATASAGRLSISNRNIRVAWPALTFNGKEPEIPGPIECSVTMEGSFHSNTIRKVADALIANITRAIVRRPCTGGEYYFHNGAEVVLGVRPATSLPWPVFYSAFTGTLPNISTLVVIIKGMMMTVDYGLGFPCLEVYGKPTEERPWVFTVGEGGVLRSLQPSVMPPHLIRKQPESRRFFCPVLGILSGVSQTVSLLNNTPTVTIRLI